MMMVAQHASVGALGNFVRHQDVVQGVVVLGTPGQFRVMMEMGTISPLTRARFVPIGIDTTYNMGALPHPNPQYKRQPT